MKRTGIVRVLFVVLAGCILTACGKKETVTKENSNHMKIVTTVFPPYDFARQIAEDKAEIVMLLSPGMESHSYEPTPKDIIAIQECDLFIYGGGESDVWVEDLLEGIPGEVHTLKMMDCMDAAKEELLEGMQTQHKQEEHGHMAETEYDEHVWTSLKNAMMITEEMTKELCEIDQENSDFYKENGQEYQEELAGLDEEFMTWRASLENPTLVFGDRFPFLYFAKDYDLNCYAAFPGCSSETEPSARTIAFLIDKVKEEELTCVFHLELSNAKAADAIAEATGTKVKMLHSCHNISKEELDSGVTYLSLMAQNLETLQKAVKK